MTKIIEVNKKYEIIEGNKKYEISKNKFGYIHWKYCGLRHREFGPAVINNDIGSFSYYSMGKPHRDDGPAIIDKFGFVWYQNGKIHREDGPAIIYSNTKIKRWYLNNILYSKKQFLAQQKDKIIKIKDELYLKDGRKIWC